MPELLIAASCSKNFGIYRERTGILMASAPRDKTASAQGDARLPQPPELLFPPDHGARLVTMILNDDTLRADWQAELEDMRLGMLTCANNSPSELRRLTGSDRFGFIAQHRGMFSAPRCARPNRSRTMREEHGIYMVGDSRLNIAGLNAQSVPILAQAIVAAGV